jgi:hypothetical protein
MTATDTAEKPSGWDRATAVASSPATQRVTRAIGLAVPVLLVNTVAFFGQFGYLKDHLPWPVAGVAMAAVALESIAIYLQWHAHLAQMANDSALRLRLASYALALVIGAMNYSHYAGPHWAPTVPAVMLGLMSAISPWLWGIHSRRVSRDELMRRGLVEEHALRLGATRWMWHALRSFRVMHRATWTGETDPARAIEPFAGQYERPVPPRRNNGTPEQPELAQRASVPAADRAIAPWHSEPERIALGVAPAAPAVHAARATLTASPRLPKGVPEERVTEVELKLAGMTLDQLHGTSAREVSRMLDPDRPNNQRRLGANLLTAAIGAKTQEPSNPPSSVNGVQRAAQVSSLIPIPVGHKPGGVASG